ncbi:hypothetical protein BofuT4_P138640.1 [Botrytis cinerea T4]|uniref:Uncharacterized protein n=1 Tax=Botryotinia fuckeliana (strain T4) TaxID=999810 RepID=G2YMU2_BOTF4|nr:hypothetical protein BofuT4_P138640.1 [Botrytis cinerea T4]
MRIRLSPGNLIHPIPYLIPLLAHLTSSHLISPHLSFPGHTVLQHIFLQR